MNITQLVTGPLAVNTWFVPLDEERLMVVDPGGDSDMIISHLCALKSTVALILLTHGHFDHMIALPALANAYPDADIAIHLNDAIFLGEGALERHYEFFKALGAGALIKNYREALPEATVILAEGETIKLRDGRTVPEWRVIHTPGHSEGSVCLYNEEEETLLSGDTLFNSGIGRTDAAGGNYGELEESLERLFELPGKTVVFPGHGPKTRIERERN